MRCPAASWPLPCPYHEAGLPNPAREAALGDESRAWIMRCPCGHQRSVWDADGIRWKAAGNPRRLLRCPACGARAWHTHTRAPADTATRGPDATLR